MSESKWFVRPNNKPDSELRLFCFPYAGGSAATFIPWENNLPSWVELIAIQPPGRSSRMFESPFNDMNLLVEDLLAPFSELLDKPYILFGHSLGSRVAYELVKLCQLRELPLPRHFIASGSRAPFIPCREKPIYDLPEDDFLRELRSLNGTPKEILDNQELMSLLLPLLRADFQIADEYCAVKSLIDTTITVLSGVSDTDIKQEDLESWGELFRKIDSVNILPGGHFFVESNATAVLKIVNTIIRKEFDLLAKLQGRKELESA